MVNIGGGLYSLRVFQLKRIYRILYTAGVLVKVKVKLPTLVIEHRGPELIPDYRQSVCR